MNQNTQNQQVEEEREQEDIEMVVPQPGGGVNKPVIPAGVYPAMLWRIFVEDLPDWKIATQTNPDPEGLQWEWVFPLTGGDYDGMVFKDYSTRAHSLHEKSKAHAYAKALLCLAELPPGYTLNAKDLVGKPCRLVLTDTNSKGEPKNYIDKVLPAGKVRAGTTAQESKHPVVLNFEPHKAEMERQDQYMALGERLKAEPEALQKFKAWYKAHYVGAFEKQTEADQRVILEEMAVLLDAGF